MKSGGILGSGARAGVSGLSEISSLIPIQPYNPNPKFLIIGSMDPLGKPLKPE